VTVLDGRAAALPLTANSFDSAVVWLVLCSVEDQTAALGELRRVLRPRERSCASSSTGLPIPA
jgi:ubiquinone/menaquinone biosynthesis C-methylase UbiE